jgi:hypothetical protein
LDPAFADIARLFPIAATLRVSLSDIRVSLAPRKRAALPVLRRMPTIGKPCIARSFRQESELAVLDDDQYPGALVHAIVIGRAHVEHTLATDDVLFLLQRVAQCNAKCVSPPSS